MKFDKLILIKLIMFFFFFFCNFLIFKIAKFILILFLNVDVTFFNIILLAMSAFNVPTVHSVCHISNFY